MQKVLIITYHFPPYRTGGVYRHLKFSKYLSEFGWEPIVLTVKNPSKSQKDLTLLEDVPEELSVHYSRTLEFRGAQKRIVDVLPNNAAGSFPRKILKRMFNGANKLLDYALWIPDDKIGWLPHTILAAKRIIERDKIELVCTTSPPHSTHLVGLWLKKHLGVRWVADFRDPWMYSFTKGPMFQALGYRRFIEKRLEKSVLRSADRVVLVTEGDSKLYARDYPELERKLDVVSNGFDEADFCYAEKRKPLVSKSKFVMTHIGLVYPGKSRSFLAAIKELVDQDECFKRNSVLKFIGFPSPDNTETISKLGLGEYVQAEGFRDHPRTVDDMLGTDVLLLLTGSQKNWVPGKLYEYIRAKKTILHVGDDGDSATIARKSGLAVQVPHRDVGAIKSSIVGLFGKHRRGELVVQPNHSYIQEFDRRSLTQKFARILCDAVGDGQAKAT